ncbi:MAG: AAA family ATPase, partial [Clostridiales bacterium]|nr:AAA family ATPase [Clostridiales bacterium]
MIIERPHYLNKLIEKKENGFIKVITGVRRCGKSYLLFNLYHDYLNSLHVEDKYIIELALDEARNARYRNPLELDQYIREQVIEKDQVYYVFLDEIQKVAEIKNPYI